MDPDVVVEDGDLVVRRMVDRDEDYDLFAGWVNRPHVRQWWDPDDPPDTRDSARKHYNVVASEAEGSVQCIVELRERPIGYVQFYRWSSYAKEANEVGIPFDGRSFGIDIFIGEPDAIGRGLGTRTVDLICSFLETEWNASSVILTTELDNAVAIRCYEKAGFEKVKQVLDTDTRDGQRVKCWLMVRPARGSV